MASVDDQNVNEVSEFKQQIRKVVQKLSPSSEPRASIESGQYNMQCVHLRGAIPPPEGADEPPANA